MHRVLFYILILSLFCLPQNVNALMTSTNYTIFADDFDSGLVFTSATYRLEGTAGESPVGSASSSTYQIIGGYNAMDRTQLTLNISDTALDLGTLLKTKVSSASTIVTVMTDDDSGYTLSISAASWGTFSMPNVSDGAVTTGTEEYGFSISGTDASGALTGQDNAVAAVTLMSSSTAVVNSSSSTLTFKASIDANTDTGARSQSITITVSNNL